MTLIISGLAQTLIVCGLTENLSFETNYFNFFYNTIDIPLSYTINTINDFIVIEPVDVQETIRGNFQVWEYRQTNAQLIGVDVDASYPINEKLKLNHQFSLVKGYDRSRNEPLINMPPANFKNEIVVKAQIHAGGRGKSGGVKLLKNKGIL